jgi:hypothetical protein
LWCVRSVDKRCGKPPFAARIEYRWAEGSYDRLPALAADLVGRKVDAIVASGGFPPALAAKSATSTIPIVFGVGIDQLIPKRLELLSELVPQAKVIAFLVNPNNAASERALRELEEAERAKAVSISLSLPAYHDSELHHLRAGRQSQDRQGTRPHRAANDPRPRRRGDRITGSAPKRALLRGAPPAQEAARQNSPTTSTPPGRCWPTPTSA